LLTAVLRQRRRQRPCASILKYSHVSDSSDFKLNAIVASVRFCERRKWEVTALSYVAVPVPAVS
jgi:hypothetical protein